ncbi:histidine phosphatase family protein [Janibacter terrae]|uniref:histidine phosphatase family protein n=1 Tax=Janibacter terrae TaxID=103817 RepID=UPI00082AAD44|nr:histidine phosphatase family protein [Janibacter terrae]HBO54744.1 histidine phosphatase family protein [Janibacter terrae]
MATAPGRLVLLRHGETEWSRDGRHTGWTDLPLTDVGREQASATAGRLEELGVAPVLTLTSDLARAKDTARLAGLVAEVDRDLREWDYGGYEGRSTAEIRQESGTDWDVFRDGVVPGATPGETVEEVAARASRVVARVRARLAEGDVVLVGHGHTSRILATVWLRASPHLAAQLTLDAARLSVLGHHREDPCILSWNA